MHSLELWRNFICGNETGSPGRAVSLHLARSGSQSEHRIRRILPARVLSTVLRTSSFTLYTCSKSSLVEHSTIIRNGKIQHQLLNQEYSFTITKRLPSTTHRKDRAVFTENTLESPLLSQSRHDLVFKGNLRL